ncbi:MAG: polypeptide deformylase [Candidatus Midichloriaceae bacterium]|jgi:formylmethionine deformylase/peptide deformylase|nr:polypeptide deformylase [Candidatus Midichloriaceae bacterium]
MALLTVLKDPDHRLREISAPVEKFDDELREFMASLLETMYHEQGMGIAAVQVGKLIRALIVDVPVEENGIKKQGAPIFLVNPVITYRSKEVVTLDEGCLSVREADDSFTEASVERPKSVTIKYYDLNEKKHILVVDGDNSNYDLWLARCLQHELDHLNGKLFIDLL